MKREKLNVMYQAIGAWTDNNMIGTFNHPPGFGKTYEGILAITEVKKKNPNNKVLIITESVVVEQQWKERLLQSGYTAGKDGIFVFSINEVTNWNSVVNTDLLVIDEIHTYTTENRIKTVNNIKRKYALGLTGTYEEVAITSPDSYKWLVANFPIVSSIGVEECLANNFISKFIEYNLALSLSTKEKLLYDEYSEYIKFTLRLFRNNYDLLNKCCYGEKGVEADVFIDYASKLFGYEPNLDTSIQYNFDIDKYYNPKSLKERAHNYKTVEKLRNDLIDNNQTKLKTVIDIIKHFDNKHKTLIFSKSTNFADKLAEELNVIFPDSFAAYHSNIQSQYLTDDTGEYVLDKNGKPKKFSKDKIKKNILSLYELNELKGLITCNSLDKGLDVEDINLVINMSGSTNPATYIQRRGRATRIDSKDANKLSLIINLYFKDTRDETKLLERQLTADSTIKWIDKDATGIIY